MKSGIEGQLELADKNDAIDDWDDGYVASQSSYSH